MPIQINLLAEAQSLEEQRRRDPVKRLTWIGVALVVGLLLWSGSLQLKAMVAKSKLAKVEAQLASHTNEYKVVVENQRRLAAIEQKFTALQNLATNRLLYGTLLNALQQTCVDNVQLTRLRVDQTYAFTDEVKAKTNSNNHLVPGRPPTATEKIVLTLDARDSGANPGDQVNKMKQALAASPYFQAYINTTNEVRLTSLSPPQNGGPNGPFVQFTLECRYPERTR